VLRAALSAVFFASGAAALIFETLWFHQAGLAFGNGIWASSLVLAAFMGGLAIGGAVAFRYGDGVAKPLALYAWLELGVAASGIALVYALPALGVVLAPILSRFEDTPALLNGVRLVLALLLLLVPATAMGMTLPLVARALGARDENFARVLGSLYGMNTLGAVAGVLLAELVLLPLVGIRATAVCGGLMSAAAAGGALRLARGGGEPAPIGRASGGAASAAYPLLFAAFVAGFALLGLEVVWMRVLLLFLNGSSLAFATVLALVLSGIGAGGLIAAAWGSRATDAERNAGAVALAAGVLGILGYRALPWFGSHAHIGGEQGAGTILLLALPLALGASLASGALFTLIGARLRRVFAGESAAVGGLAVANTLGAALGPLVAGFVLLPKLGMERSLFGLLLLYGFAAPALFWRSECRPRVRWTSSGVFALALLAFPFGEMSSRYLANSLQRWASSPEDRVIGVREGSAATIAYVEHRALGKRRHLQLVTNAFSMSTTAFWVRRYAKLYVYWPLAVRPRVSSALVIGYGVGNTVRALTDSPELERIDVVDISRDIVELGERVSDGHALRDPRVRVHIEDGRWFLQAASRRWDLITGEPPPHHIAGVVNLYSREYFRLLRERLNRGGVVTYWLHAELMTGQTARGILRAFCDAFEDCSLWHGSGVDFMLVGTNGATGPVSEERFTAQWRAPAARAELVDLGIEKPEQLGALFIADAARLRELLADDEPVVDDRPHLLRGAPRGLVEGLTEAWRDEDAAGRCFAESELSARLWPPKLGERTLEYFAAQHVLNQLLFDKPLPGFQKDLAELHDVLSHSDLSLPVLLLLGTDPDLQRAAREVAREQPASVEARRHLSAGSIARHDFAQAEKELSALLGTPYDRTARSLLAYLAKAGWLKQPQELERATAAP